MTLVPTRHIATDGSVREFEVPAAWLTWHHQGRQYQRCAVLQIAHEVEKPPTFARTVHEEQTR